MRGSPQTIYISGPITGVVEARHRFKETEMWLSYQGHTPLNPMEIEDPVETLENEELWAYYMKEALTLLFTADGIYMLEGWEDSRGAKLEFLVATELNIPVHFAHEDHKYV